MGEADPFAAARAAQRRTTTRIAVVAFVALLLLAAGVAVVQLLRRPSPALPGPLVAALRTTSFREAPDGSGWARLASAVPADVTLSAAAVGRDGTVAIAFSRRGDAGDRLLSWRGGAFRVAHDTATQITALAVSPEGETWVGTMQGGIVILRRDGSLFPSAQRTGGNSVVGFAFDGASPKTCVLVAGGEAFTASRGTAAGAVPLVPGSLRPVTMPANARTRHVLYDGGGDLVLAGDAGAIFVSTGSGWDDRTLAAVGDVAAVGLDAYGTLVAVQSTGHVWRETGASWEALGHVPHPPLAIGELPGRGLVVATDDGQLFAVTAEHDGALAAGYAATTEEPIFAAQVAGANVLFVSTHRARLWDGATWDSAAPVVTAPAGVPTDRCEPVGRAWRVRADTSGRVRCGDRTFRVGPRGIEAAGETREDAGAGPPSLFAGLLGGADGPSRESMRSAVCDCAPGPCAGGAGALLEPRSRARVRPMSATRGAVWVADVAWSFEGPMGVGLGGEPERTVVAGGELLARFDDTAPPRCDALAIEPAQVELDFEGETTRVVDLGDRALVLRPGVVSTVAAEGPARRATLPAPGLVPAALWRETGAVAVSPRAELALLVDQGARRRVLRCAHDACAFVEVPPRDEAPQAVGFTTAGGLWVITADHELAVRAP